MKTLRIITSMDPRQGGPSQGIRNSIPALQRMGIENEVVCLDDPTADFIGQDSFTIHALGRGKTPWAYQPRLEQWLLANIHRYDALIVHGLWQYHSYATYKIVKRYRKSTESKGIPALYVMPHGMLDPYFQRASSRRLKAIRNWLLWWLIERPIVNHADGILFTCEEELLLARQTFDRYQPRKELNVGYGIPAAPRNSAKLAHEFQVAYSIDPNQPYWLFLSRIHEKKGIDLLIKAYQKLLTETGMLPPLVIAGPGLDTTYGKEMIELANPTSEISFVGMLTGDLKWGALYGCELFVLPSHQENFGIAIVEAMACGKPVLISDKVNIWREIVAGGGGLVGEDSASGTYNLLKQWHALSHDQKNELAQASKRIFEMSFTVDQAAMSLFNTLNVKYDDAVT